MSNFCLQIAQCGWCNPYCTERIKMNSLMKLEKDWLEYGKNSRTIVQDSERVEENESVSILDHRQEIQGREEI